MYTCITSFIYLFISYDSKLKVHVEEIKYSGVGGGHRRKMIDDHEEQVANWYAIY